MAKHGYRRRSGIVGMAVGVARLVLVVAFTGVETIALGVWLAVVADAPTRSTVFVAGSVVLAAALVVEHLVTDVAVNGPRLSVPFARVTLASVTETALWIAWLVIARSVGGVTGLLAAGGALALLLVPQHAGEDGLLREESLLSALTTTAVLEISLLEAAGATAWLAIVGGTVSPAALHRFATLAGVEGETIGLGILALALLIEHTLAVRFARRP